MAHEDIEKMIADALDGDEPRRPVRPVPHGQHILKQYVELCDAGASEGPEPSAEVTLPVPPADAAKSTSTNPLSAIVRKALARVKR